MEGSDDDNDLGQENDVSCRLIIFFPHSNTLVDFRR